MALLIETRGPKHGTCNICGDFGKLTEDHTPPKGCIRIGAVELHHIIEHLSTEGPSSKGRISQNGVKYRTLCARCNNDRLGTHYDPSFIQFVNDVGAFVRSSLHLPPTTSVRTKPQRVMRSLIGHLCAQGVDRYRKGPNTEAIRDYFLDETLPLPAALEVYFWPYPFSAHVMVRDCAYNDLRVREPVPIWFLKFFPVAFLVAFDKPTAINFRVFPLSQYRDKPIDFEIDVSIDLRSIVHERWPEAPSEMNFIMYGQEAIFSSDRIRRRRS